jgi:hypothetical protein
VICPFLTASRKPISRKACSVGDINPARTSTTVKLTPQQARCAIEALPFENPKVSAVAISHMNGNDFASALDRAIERSKAPLALNAPTVIEHDPAELKKPNARYRRF